MPLVQVCDIKIYYEIHGKGRPRVLYIGETGGDLRRKPNIFDSPLTGHFELLAYDQRGLGRSDRPDRPYTMADYAEDAHALLHTLGWDRCAVMGVSFGGMVAQEAAIRYPEHVERLVLACTSSGGCGGDSYPLHQLQELSLEEKAGRLIPLLDTRFDQTWQASHREAYSVLLHQIMSAMEVGADEPGREQGARYQLEARRGHDTFERLPHLSMPVFICGGRYDAISPEANLQALHRQIPHSYLEVFEGGHRFLLQDERAFERIGAFLKAQPDSPE